MRNKILNSVCFIRKHAHAHRNTPKDYADRIFCLEQQIKYNNQYNISATYLLQYDALIDEEYRAILSNQAKPQDEIGFWLEIVKPLVEKCGIEWRGENGNPWDHHVNPGFIMAYTSEQKRIIIDTAMADFKAIYGKYPETVGSWLIDSEAMSYMSEKYSTDAFIICREQWGMDGYTLWGGPYYGAYYPNKNNMQTPAQSLENQTNTPVFRMFINDPIYCYYEYANTKYNGIPYGLFTQEPAWRYGQDEKWVKWQYNNIYSDNVDDFRFIQLGQENCFYWQDRVEKGFPMQIEYVTQNAEKFAYENLTVGQMGRRFKELYKTTPEKMVGALTDWAQLGNKSVWYNNSHYRVNVFSDKNEVWIRDIHVFFDSYRDPYLDNPCTTNGAIYANAPVVDGIRMSDEDTKAGFFFGKGEITGYSQKDGKCAVTLNACGADITMTFFDNRIEMTANADFKLDFVRKENDGFVKSFDDKKISYRANGVDYELEIQSGSFDGKTFESKDKILVLAL